MTCSQEPILGPLTMAHAAKTFTWLEDDSLRRLYMLRERPDWPGHVRYFERLLSDASQRVFAIRFQGGHVGNCGLKHISPKTRDCELWIYLGETHCRGRGLGELATRALLDEAFYGLAMDLVSLHVARDNKVARRLYTKLGFCELPVARDGEWSARAEQVVRMVLTREDR